MFFVKLKSGLGSCIAPKAGLARHPAKGMFLAGMLYAFWFEYAPDQGVVGATWLLYRQAKKARVQATLVLLVLLGGGHLHLGLISQVLSPPSIGKPPQVCSVINNF